MQFRQSKFQLFVQIEIRQDLLFAQSEIENIYTVPWEDCEALVTFKFLKYILEYLVTLHQT